ncbi:sigma-70 family RNA polymerase sigma factor [Mucilaginibacter sp. P25]|uniref:sigma-70 family RNA polymerase sigma factor n=1 Tax=unclassified Mucilaginibacter TaxID=2617802 RepID=UPI003D6704C6
MQPCLIQSMKLKAILVAPMLMCFMTRFLKAFNELIDTLPPQQRIIFNLRFNEGLSSQQIADQLEISPKTVRNQMGKALATLRKSLFLLHVLLYFYQQG